MVRRSWARDSDCRDGEQKMGCKLCGKSGYRRSAELGRRHSHRGVSDWCALACVAITEEPPRGWGYAARRYYAGKQTKC